VTINTPTSGDIYTTGFTFDWTTSDPIDTSSRFSWPWMGRNFESLVADSPDVGTYPWDLTETVETDEAKARIIATDLANNQGITDTEGSFIIDNKTPEVAVNAPQKSAYFFESIVVTWTTTDGNPDTVTLAYTLNGTDFVTIVSDIADTGFYSWAPGNFKGDDIRVRVAAKDKAGNTGEGIMATGFSYRSLAVTDMTPTDGLITEEAW